MADQNLVSYAKSCLDYGWSPDRVRSELYKAGWSRKDIEEAMASAGRPGKPVAGADAAPRQAGLESRRLMFRGVIAVILLGIGIFTYFIVLSLPGPPIIPYNTTCGDGKCEGTETYENCLADCSAPVANVNVGINPQSGPVSAGGSITFQVEVSGVSNLYGFQFNLNYDPSLLQFASAQEGTFLKQSGASTFCIEPNAASGASGSYVSVACTRLGAVGGVNGNGLLESVTFSAVASGTAQPTLSNIKLVDSNAQKISLSQ